MRPTTHRTESKYRSTTAQPHCRHNSFLSACRKEKTPAQVAAKLKHKEGCEERPRKRTFASLWQEVFWAVIKHGSIVTDQDVLPKEAWES